MNGETGGEMLGTKMAVATLAVENLDRAEEFYKNSLGLTEIRRSEWDVNFGARMGSMINLYQRGKTKAEHTQLTFHVDDLETEMYELRGKGIEFEDYDLPDMGIKTENGIATMDGVRMAWFKDTEENIIGLLEV